MLQHINILFMKLFNTNVIDTVKVCQEYFNFELPSDMSEKRKKTFLSRLSRLDTLACYLVKFYFLLSSTICGE